jgi:hypothetical protein
MKELITSINYSEVGMLKSLLGAEGIACVIRNEHLNAATAGLDCYPELWVLHDEDYARAQELLAGWRNLENQQRESWVCPGCGEEVAGQFASCWQCGCEKAESFPVEGP